MSEVDDRVRTAQLAGGPTKTTRTRYVDTAATIRPGDYVIKVNTNTAAVTVSLPPATNLRGKRFRIEDFGGNAAVNNITISAVAAQTIKRAGAAAAASTAITTQHDTKTFRSDGTGWIEE